MFREKEGEKKNTTYSLNEKLRRANYSTLILLKNDTTTKQIEKISLAMKFFFSFSDIF